MQDIAEKYAVWKLTSDPGVAMHLGFRVYPIIAPQGATRQCDGTVKTFAVVKRIAEYRDTVPLTLGMDGEAPAMTVTVDVYAETHVECRAAATAVRKALHQATESTWGSTVLYSLHKSGMDDMVVPSDGKAVPLYSYSQTFEIRVAETL
jgi:hypothetical protein